jgi:hypothetical protein
MMAGEADSVGKIIVTPCQVFGASQAILRTLRALPNRNRGRAVEET